MKSVIISLLLIALNTNSVAAQKQNNIWYFGYNAGLDFNFQPPLSISSDMAAHEGCASIADPNGNVLFYSNGRQIWDRSHQVMPNGSGLLGGESSSQAVLLVPLPNSSSIYYAFTTSQSGSDGVMAYSIIDMNLNGGMGDVVTDFKNIILEPDATEQLTSITHANVKDIWIISHRHNTNEFVSYLLTANGIETIPIVSPIGSIYGNAGAGTLKPSHNGNKLVAAQANGNDPIIEIFNFNSNSGDISNVKDLNPILNIGDSSLGIELSPNDSLLYLSASQPDLLLQLNLWTDEITVLNSAIFDGYGALQLAPDGKIYFSILNLSQHMDVINQPNKQGFACEYEEKAIELVFGTMCALGLPNLAPYSLFSDTLAKPKLGDDIFVCSDSMLTLQVELPVNCFPISYTWSDGSNGSNIIAPVSGTYWVEVNSTCGLYRDTVQVDIATCDPIVHYGLESCRSYMSDGSNMDYSEFTPVYPSLLACGDVKSSHINRANLPENKHSCTPGVNGSIAMCISSQTSCFYVPGQPSALIFDVTVIPTTDSAIRLSGLEFYQRAPSMYDWINGDSGPNNYPRRVALRILRNGIEIYRDVNIEASQQWELESISLLDDERFTVQDSSVFRFEFLPLCTVNNGATVAAWDIDEIKVFGGCSKKMETANGITGTVVSMSGAPMQGVEIHIASDSIFSVYDIVVTDALGQYRIPPTGMYGTTYIRGYKDGTNLNGVNVIDLILIQKHLLGKAPFTSLTQFIAADVNRDKQINAADLVALKKLLLGIDTPFAGRESWRFGVLPMNLKSHDVEDFKDVKEILDSEALKKLDFLGTKMGDVNGSVQIK